MALNPQHFQASLQWGMFLWFFTQEAVSGWEVPTAAAVGLRAELRDMGQGFENMNYCPMVSHGLQTLTRCMLVPGTVLRL